MGTFHRFSIIPLPEFDELLQDFNHLDKFVYDFLLKVIPENIKSCEILMRDLHKMVKGNHQKNCYSDATDLVALPKPG